MSRDRPANPDNPYGQYDYFPMRDDENPHRIGWTRLHSSQWGEREHKFREAAAQIRASIRLTSIRMDERWKAPIDLYLGEAA